MRSRYREAAVSDGKVTIRFDTAEVDSEGFLENVVVEVSNKEDGSPCVSSGQLLNLLVRVLGVLTILSSGKVTDAYYSASQMSGLIADAIQEALNKDFQVTIHLEANPDQLN